MNNGFETRDSKALLVAVRDENSLGEGGGIAFIFVVLVYICNRLLSFLFVSVGTVMGV